MSGRVYFAAAAGYVPCDLQRHRTTHESRIKRRAGILLLSFHFGWNGASFFDARGKISRVSKIFIFLGGFVLFLFFGVFLCFWAFFVVVVFFAR